MNGLFRQSVEIGFAEHTIRIRLRSFVQDGTVDDESLINEIQLPVLAESKRKKNFALNKKFNFIHRI